MIIRPKSIRVDDLIIITGPVENTFDGKEETHTAFESRSQKERKIEWFNFPVAVTQEDSEIRMLINSVSSQRGAVRMGVLAGVVRSEVDFSTTIIQGDAPVWVSLPFSDVTLSSRDIEVRLTFDPVPAGGFSKFFVHDVHIANVRQARSFQAGFDW